MTNIERNTAELIGREQDALYPRMATVVQSNARMVRIQFAEESAAGETWFASAVQYCPVGTWGVVHPMRGGGGYFEPIGLVLSTPEFETLQNSSLVGTTLVAASATDTANMLDVFSGTLKDLVPACSVGTWKVLVTFSVTASRNANSGGLTVYAGIGSGGNGVIPRGLNGAGIPISGTVSRKADGVTPTTVIRGMFSGQGAAGTTTRSAASMAITAVRTG